MRQFYCGSGLMVLALAGCGGGSEPLQCISVAHPKIVLGPGDSLQAHDDPGRPADVLRSLLAQSFPTVTVEVIAVAGSNSAGALTQTLLDGDIYVSDMGLTNDASAMTNGQPGQFPITESVANMQAFLALVPGKVVIWQTPAAIDTTVVSPPFQTALQAQAMVSFAQAHGQAVADVRSAELAIPGWQSMTLDGLHWDQDLQQRLTTEVVWPRVRDAVAKLECQ